MFNNFYFGFVISFVGYEIGKFLNKKLKSPLANPMLIGIIFCIVFLKTFNISYETYMLSGKYISFLIAPATVALVVPLYHNLSILKKDIFPILVGIIVGSFTAVASVFLLCKLFNIDGKLLISMLPQSITTAIAVPLAEEYGGITVIAFFCVLVRGIFGAVFSFSILKLLKIEDKVAKGIAVGTASHAIGTAKACEVGEIEGAMSGLSIGICGIITAIIMPLFINFI